jgi:hypothetical protein
MKVLFVGLARAIWLFDIKLLNPTGLSLQGIIEGIGKRYQFAKSPKNVLDLDEQKALSFVAGTFVNSKRVPLMVKLAIHNDGIVVDTMSSTKDCTDFLLDLITWIGVEFHLILPTDVRKAYVSQMDVECDVSLVRINPRLMHFVKSLESRVKSADGKFRSFELGGISFWTEDVTKLGAPAIMKFERKYVSPFSANHYFSQAPLETDDHIDLLNELELLLKS